MFWLEPHNEAGNFSTSLDVNENRPVESAEGIAPGMATQNSTVMPTGRASNDAQHSTDKFSRRSKSERKRHKRATTEEKLAADVAKHVQRPGDQQILNPLALLPEMYHHVSLLVARSGTKQRW
jgi:hypothetical protein